ncbi:PREDICTED: adenylate kinase 9 [Elephantulus edwardii]|uniref:adenylate kinase 9 n=1 Tax=Elephantulus edwardii TaxID=28737 RepID=UPI0003F0BB51|nr:PREDICTED: adenylate kinase 9 [Elephantulus edwardii]
MTTQEKTKEYPFVDIFNEDENERNFLLSKPVCFIIFGKPGVGKTTLARQISQAWKCIRVEALSVLEEHLAVNAQTGYMLQDTLTSGQSIPDELIIKLMLDKLNSIEVSHFGYIITEIPSFSQETISIVDQLELIKNLKLKPDIIINIKCPDFDLCQRVTGQRQHSSSGYIYPRDQWDPEVIEMHRKKKKEAQKEGKGEEEGEEEEEQEEEETFIAEMQMVAEIFQHLVQRPEDFLENVEALIKLYKEIILRPIEEIMAEHSSQYLIELDGNNPPEELFLVMMERLKYLNLRRAAVLTKLQSSEEEISDMLENGELFRTLASYKLIAPRYRWQRSRWGRICPVALKEGNVFPGSSDLSVSFLGKMYCLSSEAALKTFLLNPRPYLLPPMPIPPCKVFVFGPQYSGKTTLCNLIAEKYKGQVVDYAKLVQPRFKESLEKLIDNTIAEATKTAIKTVQEKLLTDLENRKQAIRALRDYQGEAVKKEYEELPMELSKSLEDLSSIAEENVLRESSLKETTVEEMEETTMKEEKNGDDLKARSDKEDHKEIDVLIEDTIEEVTEDHPEVVAMMEETRKMTKEMNFEQPFEKYAEILENVLKEVMKKNKNRFVDAPKYGGWIVDNCPSTKDLWVVFIEKGILPDLIVCLTDTEDNGKYLLNRLYLQNKTEIDANILERLRAELQKKKQEEAKERKAAEEAMKREEENQRMLEAMGQKEKVTEEAEQDPEEEDDTEESEIPEGPEILEATKETGQSFFTEASEVSAVPETEPESAIDPIEETTVEAEIPKESKKSLDSEKSFETVVLPEYPADAYPDVPEMEPLKDKIKDFNLSWKQLEGTLNDLTFIPILNLEITRKTPEELLQQVVETMEKPFKYSAWELTIEDYDEETEDYQAEAELDEELEEEEEEEGEEKIKEKRRHLGDTKHFCPVTLKENFILQPGNIDEAAKYREKIYYFSSTDAKEKFLEHPEEYVSHEEPLKAPPLRLCIVGPHGSGKTTCGSYLAENLGIFHIQFEEVLQEKLMLKTERKFGPEYEEDSEDEQAAKQEIEELAMQANIKLEEESTKKLSPEIQLTEEEEAIKSNLIENDPLPPEILEGILSDWWYKEPIRSTGFILDGFPRTREEVQFLGEHGLFPDAAVIIQVDDQDIFDRILPSHVEKWKLKQKKKLDRKKFIKDLKTKIRDDTISKRRAELVLEREIRKKGETGAKEEEDTSEEEPEDEEDGSIDNILNEEFPKDEEEMSDEDEEQETDATEHLRNELGEKYEADMTSLQLIQDEFEKILVPLIHINGSRKSHIVKYMLHNKVKSLVENRVSIFEKCYPVRPHIAQKLLNLTYKYQSSFGYWDPVKLSEGDTIKPTESPENPLYPVIHRQYIYFLSSKETKEKFIKNPIKYIRQPKPKPAVPIRIAIVGPPKSGKTTVSKNIASVYGLKRLSIGDALRYILTNQPETELALMLNWHLHKGLTAPDELAIQALEISLMDSVCNTAGVVIDGYPVTKYQTDLLESRTIIPMIIFELDVPSKEIFRRLILERKEVQSFSYPLHNSAHIIAVKNSKYRKLIGDIRQYYQEQHQNWYVIDGFHSKWWIWNEVVKIIQMINNCIQLYLEKIKSGKSACIDKLCITPQELVSHLGEFGQFCPVSLAESHELFDCSNTNSLEFAAEFRGHYYKMNSLEKLNKFLENPEMYVPPLAPYPLPSADMIPKRLTLSELKSRFPKCAELQGYCPVTYQDGKQRYEALIPGNINYALEYRDRIYICETEEKLQKFFRSPLKYWNQKLPNKLPPLKEPILLTSLPLPGYLEQGVATSLIKAMNAVGCIKPKFPFLSIRRSALLFIAFHLKAFNPKGSEYTRKKYKKKMDQFVERCELITYLGAKMTRKYKDPQYRAIDFDHKLQTFLSLRNIDPVNG